MSNTEYPKRASLEVVANEIFKLVARGATAEQWGQWLRVPLEHAPADRIDPKLNAAEGFARQIFKLVSRGAKTDQWAGWLRVPLEHASADGNIDLVNALIGAGADGSAGWRGLHGRTLLYAAAQGGNAEVVFSLLAAGAQRDVNVVPASSGRSALYLATVLGHEEAAVVLVKAGADVHFRDPNGYSVIFKAAEGGCEVLVRDLLNAGAWPREQESGRGLLHVAAESGYEAMASALLATMSAIKDIPDCSGDTPLIKAAAAGHLAVAKRLLAAGANTEIRNHSGYGALTTAAERGHTGVVKAILRHGAAVNAMGVGGYMTVQVGGYMTALHSAAAQGHVGVIDALVEAGADIEVKDKSSDGLTPLAYAAHGCQWRAIRALLQYGANSDVRSEDGETLLHMSCRRRKKGLEKTVELLLKAGVDETAVNYDGETPATLARGQGPRTCSPEEEKRAQLRLARAPADRAWRRRCWLVMLSSRASKARTAASGNGDVSGHGSIAADDGGESEDSKVEKSVHAGRGESRVIGQADVFGFGVEDGGLRAVVAALFGLELEGVFRTVVRFL